MTQAFIEARWQRHVQHLYGLGPRAVSEFLLEVGRERLITDLLERKLVKYGRLDIEVLKAVGGDQFPANPIRVIRGGQ